MAAPIVLPFNYQPVNTGRSSSSYTVPAGKYAYVSLYCENGGTIDMNGTSILSSIAKATDTEVGGSLDSDVSVTSASLNTLFTVPSNTFFEGQLHWRWTNGTGTLKVNLGGVEILYEASSSLGMINIKAFGGQALEHQIVAGGGSPACYLSVSGWEREERFNDHEVNTNNSTQLWLAADDALTSSGTVGIAYAEFNNIS